MARTWIAIAALLLCGVAQGQVLVGTQNIRDGAVTEAKIANGAVTSEKLAEGLTAGSVWGAISGSLANQTDLWAVLNGKAATNGSNAAGDWNIGADHLYSASTGLSLVPDVGMWFTEQNIAAAGFIGDGSLLENLPVNQFGTAKIPVANLGTGTPTASTYLNGAGTWTAKDWLTSASSLDATKLTGTVALANGGTGATTASGARTALGTNDAGNITAGTLSDARLSSNVPRLNAANTFTSNQVISASSGFPLSVKLAGNNWLTLQNGSGTSLWNVGVRTGTTDLNFAENGVADGRLYLRAGGNVGIGTTSPSTTLDVNGTVKATGFRLVATPPTTSSSTGTTGDMAVDANYIYVAVGSNSWKRAALSTW